MGRLLLFSLLILAGCANAAQREAEDAEKQYELAAENLLGKDDKCLAATRAADAWLRAGDKQKYQLWALRRYTACTSR